MLIILYLDAIRERSSNGYLLIAASGGLNQQRTGVSGIIHTLCYIFGYIS